MFKNAHLNNQRRAERNYCREQFELHKQDLKIMENNLKYDCKDHKYYIKKTN